MNLKRAVITGALFTGLIGGAMAFAEPAVNKTVKTRLDHLAGGDLVLVISDLNSEITAITCQKWKMLGVNSWNHQNDFTIPAANPGSVALAVLNAHGFEGYCKEPGSLIAHTDEGDVPGALDMGPGNWKDSTKLTFMKPVR
jgi:hypothetical protein